MKRFINFALTALLGLNFVSTNLRAEGETDEVRGLYRAVLQHEGTNFYQFAKVTLRTINTDGQMKISANMKVMFGDWDSNEYASYDYDEVPLNILTRQVSIKNETSDVSMVGFLKGGVIEGEWFSNLVGKVGKFKAQKVGMPEVPSNGILVKTLSGFYKGALTNTNPQSNLPERLTTSFVTTQEYSPEGPKLKISGNVRFYLGEFDSFEYVETSFNDVQFNFYNRYLTAKTSEYGLTFKGTMTQDGKFEGVVLSDGLGEIGKVSLVRN